MGWVWFVNRAWLLCFFAVKKKPLNPAFFDLSLEALNNPYCKLNLVSDHQCRHIVPYCNSFYPVHYYAQ